MRPRHALLALLLLLLARPVPAPADPAPAPAEPAPGGADEEMILRRARAFEDALVRIVRGIRPVTVSIENWQSPGGGAEPAPAGAGSGVIVSRKGYILTNQHVVQRAARIWVVQADGERLPAELVGADERGDIALLRIDAKKLRAIDPEKADTEKLREGAWVLACGNPFMTAFDGEPIVTLGIISGLGRVSGGEFMYGDAIQHDAEINPGNSGGPLFDLNGNLLGINGRISSSGATSTGPSNSGVGYTIPMHQVRNFMDALMGGAKGTKHGDELIGLEVATARDDAGQEVGVVVTKVRDRSPVAPQGRAEGVREGDVIYQIVVGSRYEKIFNQTQYLNVLSTLAEGSKVGVYVRRGRRSYAFRNIVLGGGGR